MNILTINLPIFLKIIIKKSNNNYSINVVNTKKFNIFIFKNLKKINFDKWNNAIILKSELKNSNIKEINRFKQFIKSWDVYFYNKIKFKGKGFRIKSFKKLKLIKFYFGKSHKTFIFIKNIKKIRINKYKYLFLSICKKKFSEINNFIKNIKKINIYTLRGLRLNRQKILKRKGKKGTYI